MSRWRFGGWWPVALAGLLVAVVAVAQRPRGGLSSVFGQDINPASVTTGTVKAAVVDGGTVVAQVLASSGTLAVVGKSTFAGVNAGDVVLDGGARLLFNAASTHMESDGSGGVTLGCGNGCNATGNQSGTGDYNADGYGNFKTGLKNTTTAASCTSNTGAVCVNDVGGLAVADGSGTTVATVSAAGKATIATLAITATTDLGAVVLDVAGTGSATVRSGAKCFCWDTTTGLPLTCTVAATTLSISNGVNLDNAIYFCPTSS